MKIRLTYLSAAALALTLTACDEVDEGERFEPVEDFTPRKNVLIEDFTGQRCNNCPRATNTIASMQQLFGEEHVVAVGIHGGPLSLPAPAGLATTTAAEYIARWGVESYPSGIIDRTGGTQLYTAWTASVLERLQMEPAVDISVTPAYDAATRSLSISVATTGRTGAAGQLSVWLVENAITGYQLMPTGQSNLQYVHNHVFRTAVNGTWGEDVAVAPGATDTKTYTVALDAAWKAENMAVVAFVSNDQDGVLQVVQQPLAADDAETQE